jgi:carbonic anhydrase
MDRAAIGSVEYGVAVLRTPLILVLGHEDCGAVKAAIKVYDGGDPPDGDIAFLTNAIKPAVPPKSVPEPERLRKATDNNVALTMRRLKESKIISGARDLKILGAYCSLASAEVRFIAE